MSESQRLLLGSYSYSYSEAPCAVSRKEGMDKSGSVPASRVKINVLVLLCPEADDEL